MIVADVMSTNVITAPSNTSLAEARKILDTHGFRRLPIVDKGEVVGIVSKDALDRTGPSELTTFSIHEMSYLLNKIKVKQAMRKVIVTVSPNTTVEQAVALAHSKKVGSLLVVDDEKLVGIVTTNDFFYRILNHILGIGSPGSRIVVRDCYKGLDVIKAISAIVNVGVEITTLFTVDLPNVQKHDLVVHLATEDCTGAIEAIEKLGYEVSERAR